MAGRGALPLATLNPLWLQVIRRCDQADNTRFMPFIASAWILDSPWNFNIDTLTALTEESRLVIPLDRALSVEISYNSSNFLCKIYRASFSDYSSIYI